MEKQPLLNKIVTIKECGIGKTSKGSDMVNIKADGMYHIMFLKTDGTESVAYKTIKPILTEIVGKEVGIGYAESKFMVDGEERTWKAIRVLDLNPDPNKYEGKPAPAPNDRLNEIDNRLRKVEMIVSGMQGQTEAKNAPTGNSEPSEYTVDLSQPNVSTDPSLDNEIKASDINF